MRTAGPLGEIRSISPLTGSAATARASFRSACWQAARRRTRRRCGAGITAPGTTRRLPWSGVEPFWRFFTRSDREDGLRGVECGPEDLQPGDVIQLSFDGRRYAHCLLVVGTGRQILVCAHDEDSDFRPLSTYERQKTRFLHWMLPFSSALPSASGE